MSRLDTEGDRSFSIKRSWVQEKGVSTHAQNFSLGNTQLTFKQCILALIDDRLHQPCSHQRNAVQAHPLLSAPVRAELHFVQVPHAVPAAAVELVWAVEGLVRPLPGKVW